ncbi:MAG: hypothetical protein AB7Q29_19305 [Vicinamibacterales bacterium]
MTFRRGGAGKRRDATEPAIIEALEAAGCRVWQISGRGLPDVLVERQGRFFAGEIKSGRGRLTRAQADIPWPVWRSVEDAYQTMCEVLHGQTKEE